MRIRFTENDAKTSSFLGEGQHEVTITSAVDGQSKSGKDMITVEFTASNGKSCKDWFVTEFTKKLYSLALAAGIPSGVLMAEGVETAELRGKKLTLIRTVIGKRSYQDKDGVAQETDNFENSYVPSSGSFTNDDFPHF